MSQIMFELQSATNYSEKVTNIFHKLSRSIIAWQSTQYAITPIEIIISLKEIIYVTEIHMNPKLYSGIGKMDISISKDMNLYTSVAMVLDFNDLIRVEISQKCKYIKFIIIEKQLGKSASIQLLKIYGHKNIEYKNKEKQLYSNKKQKINNLLWQMGIKPDQNWQVDGETMITLNDLTKLKIQYSRQGNKDLQQLITNINIIIKIGSKIKQLQYQLKWLNAKKQYKKIKNINDEIRILSKRRDYYDQKYQTSRFQSMISMNEQNNKHNQILKQLLQKDKQQYQLLKQKQKQFRIKQQLKINQQFQEISKQNEWWNRNNNNNNNNKLEQEIQNKSIRKQQQKIQQQNENYQFNNPYIYNQGDADMQRYTKPLITQFGNGFGGNPELLRRYQQLELLNILGARIWMATHSENWRQRSIAVQTVLKFAQNGLPQRYQNGQTRNLFLALMEFAFINIEDKVLQTYYTSLKIILVALQPPICNENIPLNLINKSIQKFIHILIKKISQVNQRAKQISLKTLLIIFKHKGIDIDIIIIQCLKICRQQLNIKFIPIFKQNSRIILSRIEILIHILIQLKFDFKKIQYQDILNLLIIGSLQHSHNQVRIMAVELLAIIYKQQPQITLKWYRSLNGLRPSITSQIQNKLNIK